MANDKQLEIEHRLTDGQYEELNKKLSPDVVSERKQGRFKVSYVEGHYCIRQANEIFGFENWTRQTLNMTCICDRDYESKDRKGWLVGYIAHVQITLYLPDVEPRVTTGYGYGEGIDYNNPAQAHEAAVKEAETDGMKRALIKFGDQFGLALYDKDKQHVGRDTPNAPKQQAPKPQKQAGEPDDIDKLQIKIMELAETLDMDEGATRAAMKKKDDDGLVQMHDTLAKQLRDKRS